MIIYIYIHTHTFIQGCYKQGIFSLYVNQSSRGGTAHIYTTMYDALGS